MPDDKALSRKLFVILGSEVAFVEAAVERLFPTDAHGPGGKEAGVAYYIDQQLEMQKSMAMLDGSPVEHVQSRLAGRTRLRDLS
jgi:hypothetical protein